MLPIVPAERVTGYFEQPRTKQSAITNLCSFAVDGEHHFLRQVFGGGRVATPRPEECDQLRCKDLEQVGKRLFVRSVQEFFRHRYFPEESFVCHRRVTHQGSAPLWLHLCIEHSG